MVSDDTAVRRNLAFADAVTRVPLWGGDVQILVVSPSNALVAYVGSAYNGTYVTKDGGATWSSIKFSATGSNGVESLAVHPTLPNVVIAATRDSMDTRIKRSDDYGTTWTNVGGSDLEQISISRIIPSTKTPGTFYLVGTDESSSEVVTFKSTDAGATWSNKKIVVATKYSTDMAIDANDNLYVSAQDAADIYSSDYDGYLYKSTNDGTTWTMIRSFDFWPDSLQVSSNTLLMNANSNTGNSVSRMSEISNDLGATFISTTTYTTQNAGRVLTPDGSGFYYVDNNAKAIYLSSAPVFNSRVFVSSIPISYTTMGAKGSLLVPVPQDPTIFYMTNSELGVMKSTDSAATWQVANVGMGGVIAMDGTKDSAGNMYVIGNITLYKGSNIGQSNESWSTKYCPDDVFGSAPRVGGVVIAPSASVVLYAARNDLYRSSNGGDTWPASSIKTFTTFDGKITSLAYNPSNPNICYMAYSSGPVNVASSEQFIYKSTDMGASWQNMSLTGNSVQALAIDPANPTVIYAGLGDRHGYNSTGVLTCGGMWKIVDDGVNPPTKTALTGMDGYIPYAIAVDTAGVIMAACETSSSRYVVRYSLDSGATWATVRLETDEAPIPDVAYSQGAYYIAMYDGIYGSASPSQTFVKIADSNDIGNVWCLVVGSMYGGANSGIYKLSFTPGVLTIGSSAKAYNYPNPFNPKTGGTTSIRYIPTKTPDKVTVKIYTLSGELVWEYDDTVKNGTVTWNGKNQSGELCAPGIYFTVVDMDGTKARNKIALVY
jgi:uncharacterized protein (DUF736 family)